MRSKKNANLIFQLHMKKFSSNPSNQTFEVAREIFLICRKYQIETPELVMKLITLKLDKDHATFLSRQSKSLNDILRKEAQKELLLRFALESNRLEDAYKLFIKHTGVAVTNVALRKRLQKHIDEELSVLFEESSKPFSQDLTSVKSQKLTRKVAFVREYQQQEY